MVKDYLMINILLETLNWLTNNIVTCKDYLMINILLETLNWLTNNVVTCVSCQALDTTDRDRAVQELERERETRRRVEMEGAQLRLQFQLATQENNTLRAEIERLKQQLRQSG